MKTNWQTKKLGELAEYINGYPFKPTDWVSSGLPIIRIQNLNDWNKDYHYFNGDIGEKYRVRKGDILISWSASLGSYIWDKDDAWLNQHIFKVLVNESEVNRDFFYFISMTILEEMKRKTHGGTMKHITKNLFENIQVQVPPLSIQQQIVERLDAIRKLQELNNQQISKIDEFHQNLINEEIKSDKYSMARISEITKPQELINPKKSPNDEYQYVDISAVDSENLAVDLNKVKRFKGKDAPSRARKKIEMGDILFSTVRPNLKRIAKVDFPTYNSLASTGFTVLRPDINKVNPDYMGTVTCSGIVTEQVLPQMKGAAYPAVSDNDVFNAEIPLPDKGKQNELADRFLTIQRYRWRLIEQRDKLSELFESTLNKVMKGELIS